MNHNQRAVSVGLLQDSEERAVINHQGPFIGQKTLETRNTFFDHFRNFIKDTIVKVADGYVEPVIYHGLAFGFFSPGSKGIPEGHSLSLNRKIHKGRCPPECGGNGPCFKIVAGCFSHEGHIEMGMNINGTGENIFPFCVNNLIGLFGKFSGNGLDFTVPNPYFAFVGIRCRNNVRVGYFNIHKAPP